MKDKYIELPLFEYLFYIYLCFIEKYIIQLIGFSIADKR